MASIKNAAPRSIRPGIKDESGGTLQSEVEQLPQHLPFFYLQTERGPLDPQMVVGAPLQKIFGSKTFDVRGKFYNHHTYLAQSIIGAGNQCFIKRVVAADAKSARFVLALEIVLDDAVPVYLRGADGKVLVDAGSGEKQQDGSNVVEGYKLRWSLLPVDDATDIKTVATQVGGTLTGKTGETSTIYPILGLETYIGDYGNNMGIRLSAPVDGTNDPADAGIVLDQNAMLYRAQLVELSETGTAVVQETINSERYIDFAFKEGVFDRATNLDLGSDRIVKAYEDNDPTSGRVPTYGPFQDMHVYSDNIATVLGLLKTQEELISSNTFADAHLINFLTGKDMSGVEYESFIYSADSISLDEITTHFATGGNDGTVSVEELGNRIIDEMNYNWENPDYALKDVARYPFSAMYDTGFPSAVKDALMLAMGYRPDVHVAFSTHDLVTNGGVQNTIAEESSITGVLNAKIGLFPESQLYGTSVCRAVIVGHAGYQPNSPYKGLVSFVHDLAMKRAEYAGSGDGKMRPNKRYDEAPLNRVAGFSDVNCTYKKLSIREADWEAGLNYVQYNDRQTLFYPAFQTVYKDDTSILNSEMLMTIMVDVTKLCDVVWRELSGQTRLTKAQFIEKSNQLMNDLVEGRYDDRVTIVPTTYFTTADDARGYSWTMDVAVYGDPMKTVGTFNVIAKRRADLEA